jgi:hypothetical protein
MEIAQNAIPTPAWTAPRTRRPQRPTGGLGFTDTKEMPKMTRLAKEAPESNRRRRFAPMRDRLARNR